MYNKIWEYTKIFFSGYYGQVSLQKFGRYFYLFQKIVIYNDDKQISDNVSY